LFLDANGNFYVASGSTTGNTPSSISNSTAAVYKLIPTGNLSPVTATYSLNSLGSSWSSPAATAVDSAGDVWVTDYGAQKIYEMIPATTSATETNYTKQLFQTSTAFTCLRTLTVSKVGQLFGLESAGSGCVSGSAVPLYGGTPPHNAGTPSVGSNTTQEVDVSCSAINSSTSYSVST
jgi:hypothetical protein